MRHNAFSLLVYLEAWEELQHTQTHTQTRKQSHIHKTIDKRRKLTSTEKTSFAVSNPRHQDQFLVESLAPHSAGQQEPERIKT